jgi:hypothetical protein
MRSTNRSPLVLALAALAGLALLLGACSDDGGDDDEAATTTTAAEDNTDDFVEQVDSLCAAGRAAADEAGEDLDAALAGLSEAESAGDTAAYDEALEEAETAAEGIIDSLDDFEAAVAQLEVPADLQGALDDYLEVKEEQFALAEDLRDAIVADDGDAFQATVGELEETEAEFDERSLEAAQALGAAECEPELDEDEAA